MKTNWKTIVAALSALMNVPAFAADYKRIKYSCTIDGTEETITYPEATQLPGKIHRYLTVTYDENKQILRQEKTSWIPDVNASQELFVDTIEMLNTFEMTVEIDENLNLTPGIIKEFFVVVHDLGMIRWRNLIEHLGSDLNYVHQLSNPFDSYNTPLGVAMMRDYNFRETASRVFQFHNPPSVADGHSIHLRVGCKIDSRNG